MAVLLHYLEKGEGEPLVLLHGNSSNLWYFQHQIEVFSKQYRVIAVDTRGHGYSRRGVAPFTMEQFSSDLLRLFDHIGLESANLLGFSDGANIALTFILEHPERVKKLILVGANLDPSGVKPIAQKVTEAAYRTANLFAKRSQDAKRKAEILGLMVNEPHINPQSIKSVFAPTLVLAGTKDVIKESHTRMIAENIPNSRLLFLEGGHNVIHTQTEAFEESVLNFLNEPTD